jgi:hypothetical protein
MTYDDIKDQFEVYGFMRAMKNLGIMFGTDMAMSCIRMLNRHKDRCLSTVLHRLADRYDTRPTGEWD